MKWLKDFQLYLFDFDGLLVNTEHIHFQAYIDMCEKRGFKLDWIFLDFCKIAHYNDTGLRDSIYAKFPKLQEREPNWNVLRNEKNQIYLTLLNSGRVELMPGVKELLEELNRLNINRCVVTNSTREQINLITALNPILKTIPHWITREEYIKPKPDPESYERAILLYAKHGDKIIGFEDTIRGMQALSKTPAFCLLISPLNDPRIDSVINREILHFGSIKDLPQDRLL